MFYKLYVYLGKYKPFLFHYGAYLFILNIQRVHLELFYIITVVYIIHIKHSVNVIQLV